MLSEKDKNGIILLCQNMIKAKSYSGEEKSAAQCLASFFNSNGFDDVKIDKYGNVIGCIRGKYPGKKILFDGHIDTVPVPDESAWNYPPFGAEIHEGKIYGRGTSDMKGAVASMAYAAAKFAKDSGKEFHGEIYVAGVVHEECFEGVAARNISSDVNPDVVIIGEASSLNLKVGQRGRAEIVVETFGVPAHSANPEKGINAVYSMLKLVEEIKRLKQTEHEKLGAGILELIDIKSEPYPGQSVVPSYCKATYDRRLLFGETEESVLAPIQKLIDELKANDPNFNVKVSYAYGKELCYTGETIEASRFFPAWIYDESHEEVAAIKREMNKTGFNPEITYYNFCTNGSHYAGEAGIMTIGLGPSVENLAHTINEYIEVEQLTKSVEAYTCVMSALLL